MASFRNYPNSDAAQADAAFLRAMGLDAVVFEDGAVGGGLLSSARGSVRIELPESQLAEAEELMNAPPSGDVEPPVI